MSATRTRVVIVTWNGVHLLAPCLESLREQQGADFEVVVVDNASQDDTLEWLSQNHPEVAVVASPRNTGFAGGVNLGIEGFDGEFVVLLNNDATLEPQGIRRLVAHADHPAATRVAAFTAKVLLEGTQPPLVNSTGNVVTRAGAGADRDWLVPDGEESQDSDVFGFCGAAVLLRMSALREVGLFDASLFLYYEDTDLSWRLRARDWEIRYVADVVARHQHAASSDETSALFRYYNTRNSLIVMTRHAPAEIACAVNARQLVALALHLVKPREGRALRIARAKALRDHLRRLPKTLAERRELWSGTRSGQRRRVAQFN